MDGMLLAAGLGTRLRPLTDETPKALVPIGDKPAFLFGLGALARAGCARVAINAHHHASAVERAARGLASVSVEHELLGTAGGIARARSAGLVSGDLIVWNTDIFADFDLRALTLDGCEAALLVAPRAAGEGNVGIDERGRVVRLREERFGEETRAGDFVGVHAIAASFALPERGCVVGDAYIPALARGRALRAVETRAPFVDVGTLAGYFAANRAWLGARRSFAHPSARVECALEASIVGEGASALGPGVLARTVVWPGAIARAPLKDAVVTPGRVVFG